MTLPINMRDKPLRPCEDMTIKSTASDRANQQYRIMRMLKNLLRYAPQNPTRNPGPAVRRHPN